MNRAAEKGRLQLISFGGSCWDWLASNPVDAIVSQETKRPDDEFPRAEIEAAGYQVHFHCQKTYNGVALLSRSLATEVVKNLPALDDAQARVIAGRV